jgi:nitric oxide reductase NorE protein
VLTRSESAIGVGPVLEALSDRMVSSRRRYPGQAAMWFFVIGDLWIFSCYFACYAFDRGQNAAAYWTGQHTLDQAVGVLNTILLLTSSLFIAFCVQAARSGAVRQASRFLLIGAGLGVAFLLVKAMEWCVKIEAGLPAGADDFFVYYFMFTGLHVFHVSLGLIILWLVFNELNSVGNPRIDVVESGAIYWHLVDLLWIMIFALLYLLR